MKITNKKNQQQKAQKNTKYKIKLWTWLCREGWWVRIANDIEGEPEKSELFIQYHFNSDNSCENPYVRCDSLILFWQYCTIPVNITVQHIPYYVCLITNWSTQGFRNSIVYKITTKGSFFHIFILKHEYRHHITLKSIYINIDLLSYYGSLIQERQDTK